MRTFILLFAFWTPLLIFAQSQTVEIESTNSGLLLPRLNDTSSVAKPEEGLLIYDLADKNPAFYDGSKWKSTFAAATSMVAGDSLTYTVASTAARMVHQLESGTFPLGSYSWGMSSNIVLGGGDPPKPFYTEVSLNIPIDNNWIPFQDHLQKTMPFQEEIEIDVFKSGNAIPDYTIKLKGGTYVTGVQSGGSVYSLSLLPQIIGLKHHPTNKSFAFDVETGAPAAY